MSYFRNDNVALNNSGIDYAVDDELRIKSLDLQNLEGEVTGLIIDFTIEHTNGTIYTVDDADAFVDNNSYSNSPSNPIYITADKSVSVPRANVKRVSVKNIAFKLKAMFLRYAFYNCTNLIDVTFENVTINRNGVTSINYYLFYCFYGCSSLTVAPVIPALPNGVTSANYYLYYCFYGCSSLTVAPVIPALPNGVMAATNYLASCFQDTSLTSAPTIPGLPSGVTNADSYLTSCFYGTSIAIAPTIPALPSSVTSANYYLGYCFKNCSTLATAPTIPALPSGLTSANYYLYQCFYNCTLLTNALISNIPPFTGAGITGLPSYCTTDYAGGTCPASPDTPITDLAGFLAGYNYH